MNSKVLHYVKLGLGAVVTLCQYAAHSDPQIAAYAQLISGVCGAALMGLGGFGLATGSSDPAAK